MSDKYGVSVNFGSHYPDVTMEGPGCNETYTTTIANLKQPEHPSATNNLHYYFVN